MKIFLFTLSIVVCGVGGYFLAQHQIEKAYLRGLSHSKVDTIYVDQPYEVTKWFRQDVEPQLIYKYLPQPYEVVIHDTIIKVVTNSDTLYIKDSYIGQYPVNDKLIQMLLDKSSLNLTTLNYNGDVVSRQFNIDTDSYSYNYYQDRLTSNKRSIWSRIHGDISYTYGLNNFHGLKTVVSLNMTKNWYVGLEGQILYLNELKLIPGLTIGYKLF
jgi:hypothetical protein